jgi:hypothetical protein
LIELELVTFASQHRGVLAARWSCWLRPSLLRFVRG